MNPTTDNDAARLPDKLRECTFVDLFVGSSATSVPMVRSLRRIDGAAADYRTGVLPVPACLHDDVKSLIGKVDAHYAERHAREFTLRHDDQIYRCALIATPGVSPLAVERGPAAGNDWCIRRVGTKVPPLEQLGMPAYFAETIRDYGTKRGLVMVSGAFGSGKSTTAAAILTDWVQANRESAITLEDPPEFPLDGRFSDGGLIRQIEISDATLSDGLRYARRWSPRYLFLGEVRTPDAAAEILHMSISGPMTICTIHASDPVQAIVSMARFASGIMAETEARRLLASALKLVIHQDMSWGHLVAKMANVGENESFGVRNKIETGLFSRLYEDFDRQGIKQKKT